MKNFFLSLIMTFAIGVVYSQSNVAYMYSSEVFSVSSEYGAAKAEIDAFVKKSNESVEQKLNQAKGLFEIYNKSAANLNSSQVAELKKMIVGMEKLANKYQESVFGKDGELEKLQKKLMAPVEAKIVGIVSAIAKEKGYSMVFDLSVVKNTIYQSDKANITALVIERLKAIK